jgi:hypothetical protein
MMKWISGSVYDVAQKHAPVAINDYTSTKRFVCLQCSRDIEGITFPNNGVNWPCDEAQELIDNQQWDAILLGIADTYKT